MLDDLRQSELDNAEKIFFTNLFGGTTIDAKTEWLLNFFDIDVNKSIQTFENLMKPVMNNNGLVNSSLAKSLIASKYPMLSNLIPDKDFRLSEIVNEVSSVLLKTIKRA